jgi:hypothetical protein
MSPLAEKLLARVQAANGTLPMEAFKADLTPAEERAYVGAKNELRRLGLVTFAPEYDPENGVSRNARLIGGD